MEMGGEGGCVQEAKLSSRRVKDTLEAVEALH